jgi:hypothetical protein
LLFRADPAHQLSQTASVDSADLLNQHARGLAEQVNFRAE